MDVRDEGEAALAARAAARRARQAADADSLAGDSYVHDALERLHAAITDLAGARWATRGPDVLVAALRALTGEQARLDAAALRLVGDVDGRDDVVPRAKPKTAGASMLRTALGMERRKAAREADLARLATGTNPDLAEIGAAYAAGEISRGHLEIAAGVHRRLGAFAREQPMGVADADTGEVIERRTIEVVDGTLAARARDFTVAELVRIGDRLVETLNPPSPEGAHRRRFLHLSQLADGSLQGRFFCGPEQALKLIAVITALAAPRPGKAVDPDGVERDLPDDRSAGQRRMDGLVDAIDRHPCAAHLLTPSSSDDDDEGNDGETSDFTPGGDISEDNDIAQGNDAADGSESSDTDTTGTSGTETGDAETPPGGEWQIRRSPGIRSGPYPDIEIIVTATLDQLAHARALAARRSAGGYRTLDGFDLLNGLDGHGGRAALGGNLQPPGQDGFARAQHGGGVHPTTLALLACNARLRRVVLDEHGAALHLGRSHRLATPAQKAALFARDVGCVIPGCDIPGALCEIHHVIPWADGGTTDIDNLAFVCPRHHVEVTDGSWDAVMVDRVPWARPPAWADPGRPLLRNATHHSPAAA